MEIKVSKNMAQQGAIFDLLKLGYLLNSKKLKDKFEEVQVDIEDPSIGKTIEDRLQTLANLHEKKIDLSGNLKDGEGNSVIFDTKEKLKEITWTPEEKNKVLNNPDNFTE